MGYNIAVIGVSDLVGHEIITILSERDFPIDIIHALTSKRQSGKDLSFGDKDIRTKDVETFDFNGVDFVFYAQKHNPSKEIILKAVNAGAKVIDSSGVMTFEDKHENITILPLARSQQLVEVLNDLHDESKIKRITVSTYEGTSGAGRDGMDELFSQSRKFFVTDGIEKNVFKKQIAFNVLPQVEDFMDDGQTESEWRVSAEIKKFIDNDIKTTITCVQVPVFIGYGMSVNVEFENDMDVKMARSLWRDNPSITIIDEKSELEYVTPAEISGEDAVFISRIRNDQTLDNGISFWCVADNIRATAALNAVKVVERKIAS